MNHLSMSESKESLGKQDSIEIQPQVRPILSMKQFSHQYDPNSIDGEFLCTVKETDFKNYYVPRRVIRE